MKRQVKKGFLGVLIAVATMAITLFAGGCKKLNIDEWFCDHKYNDGTVIVDADCTMDGKLERTCTSCGKKKKETIIAVGHEFDEGEFVLEATCTTTGVKEYECKKCHELKTETLSMLPHNKITFAGTPATCTEAGVTEGYKCADCNTVLLAQSVIPAKGHKTIIDHAVSATCTETGLTAGSHCEWCGEIFQAQEEIAALGHNVVTIEGHEATCMFPGLTNGAKCDRCDTVYTEQEIISVAHIPVDGKCQECGRPLTFFTSFVGEDVSYRRIAFSHTLKASDVSSLFPTVAPLARLRQIVAELKREGRESAWMGIALSNGDYFSMSISFYEVEVEDGSETVIKVEFEDEARSYRYGISLFRDTGKVLDVTPTETWVYDFMIEKGVTVTRVDVGTISLSFFCFVADFLNVSAGGVTV